MSLACFFGPLDGGIAVKHDRAQKFIRRLLREDACIAEWSASLRYALGFPRLRFGTVYPQHDEIG